MIVVLRPVARQLVDQVFGNRTETSVEKLVGLEFPLRGTTTVSELEDMYGITMGMGRELTLDEAVRKQLGRIAAPGLRVRFGPIGLSVRRIAADKTIEQVGMTIYPEPEDVPMKVDGKKDDF